MFDPNTDSHRLPRFALTPVASRLWATNEAVDQGDR